MKLNKKGFTLVELLAVILILAILGAILVSSTQKIIKNSRIDSFIQSLDMVTEAADLACSQSSDSNYKDIQDYIKKSSGVTVSLDSDTDPQIIIVTAKGQFAGLDYAAVKNDLPTGFNLNEDKSDNKNLSVSVRYSCVDGIKTN